MLIGYFLNGVEDDHVLVFRTDDKENILRIINKLKTSRDKELKELAITLEKEYYERDRRDTKKAGPKNKAKGQPGK